MALGSMHKSHPLDFYGITVSSSRNQSTVVTGDRKSFKFHYDMFTDWQ